MFGAIQDEVDKLTKFPNEEEKDTELELEEEYEKLRQIMVNLEDLDTNQENDELSNDDFNKLKDLVMSGNRLPHEASWYMHGYYSSTYPSHGCGKRWALKATVVL